MKIWIHFWFSINGTTYSVGKGFLGSYAVGMEHNTAIVFQYLQLV
jgi:hypothetical protein